MESGSSEKGTCTGATKPVVLSSEAGSGQERCIRVRIKAGISKQGKGLMPREQSQCAERSHDAQRGLGLEACSGAG